MERVVFYSRGDFCYGLGLEKVETLEIPSIADIGLCDAIEFYEIQKYFEDGARLKSWSDDEYECYTAKAKSLYSLTMQFFGSLDDEKLSFHFPTIDISVDKTFWELFEKCQLHKRISETAFGKLIHSRFIPLDAIFSHKSIVQSYGKTLRLFLMENLDSIRIILSVYEQSFDNGEKLYLPQEFSGQDIRSSISAYIDSEQPNCNFLDRIFYMKYSDRYPVTDEIRLKAKHRSEKEREQILKNGISVQYGIRLILSPNQIDEMAVSKEGDVYQFSYSIKWLKETFDYPSIMNNFLYLFEYADIPQMRCQLVSTESQFGILERTFLHRTRQTYPRNNAFNFINNVAVMQMAAYYSFLKDNGIRYEDVLTWVFTQYLQEEFHCSEMRVSFPSEGTTYAEKCTVICSAIETILKQFDMYAEDKQIDFDLLKIQSGSKRVGDIHSLVNKKYLYPHGKDFVGFKNMLFSDQSTLMFVSRFLARKKEYSSFYDLITREAVNTSDYSEYDQPKIAYLAKNGLITVDDAGFISLGDRTKIKIIKDLNDSEVISKWHYPPSAFPIFQEWIDKGLLREGTRLFSEPESNYFDYLLNDAKYNNGPKIRNKYSHGIQQVVENDNEHMQNYFVLLQICTIIAIKINDDFCLYEYLQKEGW